ncbi:tRNA 2-thiouridine synthesizing protein A [Rhodovulum imhoffii]|uniref:tRNA 2-thiouridine synthesizing protein A n=1 Tax=Rhodovulum imhoffii TaxID=365340 RepID=A0A2T5BNQ7_9RHOB|nr:sulfurtransferase TusA family protein [Rhodovulum imhoffii]MBK5932945.1 preprotein translocase subunit TatB [Rhodovulum imhoffii]PTN00636.1 tRNA 2-thiouridine synthesizing protein A [Rhodovulum imhoffii]
MSDLHEIDARGLRCPLPVLKLRKALAGLSEGAELRLWADDPMALIDIPNFCTESGHTVLAEEETRGGHVFVIRCGKAINC